MARPIAIVSYTVILFVFAAAPVARAADDPNTVRGLQGQIAKLTAERDALKAELEALRAEIAALKAPDAAGAGGPMTLDAGQAAASAKTASWDVEITSIAVTDQDATVKKLEAERKRLDEIDDRLAAAKQRHADMASAKSYEYEKNRGVEYQQKKVYSREQIADARLAATKIENERRKQAQLVARLERESASGATSRTIAGRLDDGTVVDVTTDTDTAARIAETLEQGKRYKIQGIGIMADGVLKLSMKSAAPADPAAVPGKPVPPQRRVPAGGIPPNAAP